MPKILRLKLFGNSWGISYVKFVTLNIKLWFTCGQQPVLKNYEVTKSCYLNCLKIFVLISTLPIMIKFLEKVLIFAHKVNSKN